MSFPNVPKDPGGIPFSSIYIPGSGWVALQGATPTTDGSGNQSAPLSAALYGKVTNPGDTPLLLDSAGRAIITVNSGTVTISNANANGQATMVNSSPVALASDQSTVPILQKNVAWTSLYTTTQTGVSSWAGSGDIDVHLYSQILINCQVTAITGTSIQFKGSRKDAFNNYPGIWNPAAQTTTGGSNTSWGPGLSTNHLFGSIIQVTVALVAITSVTFTVDVQGR